MTLTEADLAAALAARTGQPLPEAERAVDGMVALMRAALLRGETLELEELGSFSLGSSEPAP